MENAMENMYKKRFENGFCRCFESCKVKKYDPEVSFFCNKSARVGKRYAQSKVRVVFIGKEDVSLHKEMDDPSSFIEVTNRHYIATKHILAALLGYCGTDEITLYNNNAVHFENEDKLHEEFALTNHYHCAFRENTKRFGVKTTDTMWENCAALVKKELEILCPHVIVIQAGWTANKSTSAKKRIEGITYYFDSEKWTISEDSEIFGLYVAENKKTGEICYVIGSYHPSFPRWNNDEYLTPLKKRIDRVKELLDSQN